MTPKTERQPLPITNQKIWDMSKRITGKLKEAYSKDPEKAKNIYWAQVEELYFDWLEEELFGEQS